MNETAPQTPSTETTLTPPNRLTGPLPFLRKLARTVYIAAVVAVPPPPGAGCTPQEILSGHAYSHYSKVYGGAIAGIEGLNRQCFSGNILHDDGSAEPFNARVSFSGHPIRATRPWTE